MILINQAYAMVHRVEPKGNLVKGSISTNEVNKQTNEREYSNWNAIFVGKCKDLASTLKEKSSIKITSGKISNRIYEGKIYTTITIFDFEVNDFKKSSNTSKSKESNDDSTELPF
jgi:hypothetical protein